MDAKVDILDILPLADFLSELLSEARKGKEAAEKKRDALNQLQAENVEQIVKRLLPFSQRVAVTRYQANVIGEMIADAGGCMYSYMRHNQIVGLVNMVLMLGLQ